MARELGDVGTHFLFENENVKIWDLILELGQASPWHHHTTHYLFIVTEPGRLTTVPPTSPISAWARS